MNKDLVRIIENPVIFQNLCTMRDKRTDSQGVRLATRKITRVLLYEAAKNLPLVEKEIETPIKTTTFKTIKEDINIIISPILRAGLIFTDEAIDILPQACIRHIGMYRDEKTLKPVWYYNKVPMATPNPEMYWDITVASAAPFTPLFNTNTKKRSKAILKIVETPRKAKGTVEFPKALRNEENQL